MTSNKQENNLMGGNKPGKKKQKFNVYWVYGIIALIFVVLMTANLGGSTTRTNPQVFKNKMLLSGDVEKVIIVNEERVEVFIKSDRLSSGKYNDVSSSRFKGLGGPHYVFDMPAEAFRDEIDKLSADPNFPKDLVISYEKRKDWTSDLLGWILLPAILIVVWIVIFRRMSGGAGGGSQIFNIGKSKAKIFDRESNVKTDFKDVAGLEEAKVEIKEIVDFLKKPKKYTQLGGKIPKGALLVGPPGTGKTLLAKAVAGEAHVPFFSISGSDFVEMFVGVGASRVRDLFKQAKEKAPCIIFIDEIDAIGRARSRNPNQGANDERENTLNQLLTEMDGFDTNSGVIILAATNRADILDKALMRAGRFDRQIHVELPELNERKAIFKVHTKPLKVNDELDTDFLARQTPGFSGADIANVCNEAALIAARGDKEFVDKQDFLDAVDRIIGGLEKRNKVITLNEKKTIAYHEAGHATVSWLLEYANPLVKVTIVPRGSSLGAAWYLPEERKITTKEQMFDELCSALGGRASEELTFERISTGALNDLERTTKQAYAMVAYFGMSDKIGNLSFYDSTGHAEYLFNRTYSEKTAEIIDTEVSELIEKQYARAKQILADNIDGLVKIANKLLDKEVIFSDDLEEVFGKRKGHEADLEREEAEEIALKKNNKFIADQEEKEKRDNDNEIREEESDATVTKNENVETEGKTMPDAQEEESETKKS